MKKFIGVLLPGIIFLLHACSKGGSTTATDPCTGLTVSFSVDIRPIVNTNCATSAGCHAAGSINSGGPFVDYNSIFAKSSQIKVQVNAGFMPKSGFITTAEKNKIICWINNGAPNN